MPIVHNIMSSPEPERVFISFGGPAEHYRQRVYQICENVASLDFFTQVIPYTDQDLINDEEFWDQHGDFMSNSANSRGYGFWMWKSYIIHKTLATLNDGDFLVYADAGCEINPNGMARMKEYQEMLDKNDFGLITFHLLEGCEEFKYSKRILLDYMKCPDSDKEAPQIMATALIMKKTPRLVKYIESWFNMASSKKYIFINDAHVPNEYPGFRDHRHDQSVHSQLIKAIMRDPTEVLKPIIIADETWFDFQWDTVGGKYPIWAKRIRHPL